MVDLDFNDIKSVERFAKLTVELSSEYAQARLNHALTSNKIGRIMTKLYQDGLVEEKHSYEKAIFIGVRHSTELAELIEKLNALEARYKGIEKEIESRQQALSFFQSVMKYENFSYTYKK